MFMEGEMHAALNGKHNSPVLSPGPPSVEGMISLGDPRSPWARLSSVCSPSEFFMDMCEKCSKNMSRGFPLTSANTGVLSSGLGQIHPFTF